MKKLLFFAVVATVVSASLTSCSKEEDAPQDYPKSFVKSINVYCPDGINLPNGYSYIEYDSKNRVIRYDDITYQYDGDKLYVHSPILEAEAVLNEDGYISEVTSSQNTSKVTLKCKYDSYGYLIETVETWYHLDAMTTRTTHDYEWENGNLKKIAEAHDSDSEYWDWVTFSYNDNVSAVNLELQYLLDDYGPVSAVGYPYLGMFGFFGKQSTNHFEKIITDSFTLLFDYEYNEDGTVSNIEFDLAHGGSPVSISFNY